MGKGRGLRSPPKPSSMTEEKCPPGKGPSDIVPADGRQGRSSAWRHQGPSCQPLRPWLHLHPLHGPISMTCAGRSEALAGIAWGGGPWAARFGARSLQPLVRGEKPGEPGRTAGTNPSAIRRGRAAFEAQGKPRNLPRPKRFSKRRISTMVRIALVESSYPAAHCSCPTGPGRGRAGARSPADLSPQERQQVFMTGEPGARKVCPARFHRIHPPTADAVVPGPDLLRPLAIRPRAKPGALTWYLPASLAKDHAHQMNRARSCTPSAADPCFRRAAVCAPSRTGRSRRLALSNRRPRCDDRTYRAPSSNSRAPAGGPRGLAAGDSSDLQVKRRGGERAVQR